jgi:hypothetical protein
MFQAAHPLSPGERQKRFVARLRGDPAAKAAFDRRNREKAARYRSRLTEGKRVDLRQKDREGKKVARRRGSHELPGLVDDSSNQTQNYITQPVTRSQSTAKKSQH